MNHRLFIAAAASILIVACSNDDRESADTPDTGTTEDTDTSVSDTGAEPDAVASDTATEDDLGPVMDAGPTDTNPTDVGPGPMDAAPIDVSPPDAQVMDVNPPDVPENDVDEPSCTSDTAGESCAEAGAFGVCAYTLGCDSAPECILSCSDAIVNVCGCDGIVHQVTPDCSTVAFAYRVRDVYQRNYTVGLRCDPNEDRGVRYDLVVNGTDFDDWAGQSATIRIPDSFDGSTVIEDTFVLDGGSWTRDYEFALDADRFGWSIEMYVDLNSNGICDPGEEASFSAFVNNTFDSGPLEAEMNGTELEAFVCEEWE